MATMDVKIIKFTQTGGLDAQGRPVQQIEVTFSVGTHGPFMERFPKEELTSTVIMAKLNAFARELQMLPGVES